MPVGCRAKRAGSPVGSFFQERFEEPRQGLYFHGSVPGADSALSLAWLALGTTSIDAAPLKSGQGGIGIDLRWVRLVAPEMGPGGDSHLDRARISRLISAARSIQSHSSSAHCGVPPGSNSELPHWHHTRELRARVVSLSRLDSWNKLAGKRGSDTGRLLLASWSFAQLGLSTAFTS